MSDQYGNGSSPAPSPPAASSPTSSARYVRGHRFTFGTIDGERGAIAYTARCLCGEYRCSSSELDVAAQARAHLNGHAFTNGER